MIRVLLSLCTILLCSSCVLRAAPIRIGHKSYNEQAILAEILRTALSERGIPAEIVPCDDTWSCHELLKDGGIDVLFEYTGTAAYAAGGIPDPIDPVGQVSALYEPYGLRWTAPLGFDNGYVFVMDPQRAAAMRVRTIADLAAQEYGVRFAVTPEYEHRAGDGLGPLVRRHAIRMSEQPRRISSSIGRLEAVMRHEVDVSLMFATDALLNDAPVVVLEDTLDFFPAYLAAGVVRSQAIVRQPALLDVLNQLGNHVQTQEMRELNFAVDIEGQQVQDVARRFLVREGLASPSDGAGQRFGMTIAIHDSDRLGPAEAQGVLASHRAWPGRSVHLQPAPDPASAVVSGESRLALMGAERFFRRKDNGTYQREERVTAVAVVGQRWVHVLRAKQKRDGALAGRIGIPTPGTGEGLIASALLQAAGIEPARRGPDNLLLAELRSGALDGIVLVAPIDDPSMIAALDHAELADLGKYLNSDTLHQLPFGSRAAIPAGSYAGQAKPVETIAVQIVLATATARPSHLVQTMGPVGTVGLTPAPIPYDKMQALVDASPNGELPSPKLPSAWQYATRGSELHRTAHRTLDTAMNLFALVFSGWLIYLIAAARPKSST